MSSVSSEDSTVDVDISDWGPPSKGEGRGETTEQGEQGGENVVWTARDSYPLDKDMKAQRGGDKEKGKTSRWRLKTGKLEIEPEIETAH